MFDANDPAVQALITTEFSITPSSFLEQADMTGVERKAAGAVDDD